jgi:hypothetical protein
MIPNVNIEERHAMNDTPSYASEDDCNPSRRSFLRSAGGLGAGATLATLAVDSFAQEAPAGGELVTDFGRSFLRWTLDTKLKPPKTVSKPLPMTLNRVRMPIEATATLAPEAGGAAVRYALGSECFAEQVWVKRDVWHDPSASMCMIGGEKHCLIEKQWARADFEATLHPPKLGAQPERQLVDPADAFAAFSIDVAQIRGVELTSTDAVMEALTGTAAVVSRTEYTACGYKIALEYPVKTVNFSERERYYQVDTGPVLFPGVSDIGTGDAPLIAACRPAFVAHNGPDWAEFLVCVPTTLRDDLRVHHYSRSVRVEGVRNRMFRVG